MSAERLFEIRYPDDLKVGTRAKDISNKDLDVTVVEIVNNHAIVTSNDGAERYAVLQSRFFEVNKRDERIKELHQQLLGMHNLASMQALRLKELEKIELDVATGQLRTADDWQLSEDNRGQH